LQDPFQGELEVAKDVVIEGFQRRNIEDADAWLLARVSPEMVEAREERRQGLARSRGREQERIPAGGDRRPSQPLGRGGSAKCASKPASDGRKQQPQSV